MAHEPRTRHYVPRTVLVLSWPALRYSKTRDAYVLRLIGISRGPVLRRERRRARRHYAGAERRRQFSPG